MLRQESIPVSVNYILYRRIVTFLRTGRILHVFFLIALTLFFVSLNKLSTTEKLPFLLYCLLSMFLFSVAITTQLDAYSRYQNYKMVKDMIYKNGYRVLIIKPFSKSRCQRDAVTEAAFQLEIQSSVDQYFHSLGYRWYHIIPTLLIENPLLLFSKGYWYSTFFVPKYKSKYFYW